MRQIALMMLCPLIYLTVRFTISPEFWRNYTLDYQTHSIVFFISFFVIPLLVIGNTNIYAGKKQFLAGVAVFLIITPLFIFLFDHSLGPKGSGLDLLLAVLLVSMNVSAVDFYVFRVVQFNFLKCGELKAMVAGVSVWLIVHIPESTFLAGYGYTVYAVAGLMILSAITLSAVYLKTRDVLGLMFGHILLNVILAFTQTT